MVLHGDGLASLGVVETHLRGTERQLVNHLGVAGFWTDCHCIHLVYFVAQGVVFGIEGGIAAHWTTVLVVVLQF